MSLNLNGRIFGRTKDGLVLVGITIEEYLEALPLLDPAAGAFIPEEPAASPALSPWINQKPAPSAAQKAFGHAPFGKPRRPGASTVPTPPSLATLARLAPRACEVCGKEYQPRRKDQRACGSPCKISSSVYGKAKGRADNNPPAGDVAAATPAKGKLSPEQKQARLDMIRKSLRNVEARRSGTIDMAEKPVELERAEREANSQGEA